jgi:hypothetical protein
MKFQLGLRLLSMLLWLSSGSDAFADAAGGTTLVIADKQSACVMLGAYGGRGRFTPATELSSSGPDGYWLAGKSILGTFRTGESLSGIDSRNRRTRASVSAIHTLPELGESSLKLTGTARWQDGVVAVLTKPPLPIRLLHSKRIHLAQDIDILLRREIDGLIAKHLPERVAAERPSRFEVGRPIAESLSEAPDIVLVKYPLALIGHAGERDDRAQAFFHISVSGKRVVRAAFGHAEWAFASSVLTIWPEMYFRVAGEESIYFVGLHQGGWEDAFGRAIYDLRTGKEVLICY